MAKKPRLSKDAQDSSSDNKQQQENGVGANYNLPIALDQDVVLPCEDAEDPLWTCPQCDTKWHERRLLKIDNEPMCASLACEHLSQGTSRKGKNALLNIQPHGICNNGHVYLQRSVRAAVKKCPFMHCTATLRQTCFCGESFTLDQKTSHQCAFRKPKRLVKGEEDANL